MSVTDLADDVARWVGDAQDRIGAMFEPTLRLGVTGLSRAGKTVFIASLAANLLRRARLSGLAAEAEGRIVATRLSPQPDLNAPRFDFEAHLSDLYGDPPTWPESTRAVAQLRVSIRFRSAGTMAGLAAALVGDKMLHLDIVDYPGEWLLDLPLLDKSYSQWAAEALETTRARAASTPTAARFLSWAENLDRKRAFDEQDAQYGAHLYAQYLHEARAGGLSGLAPGRFLLPGELDGAPIVTFAPLPDPTSGDETAKEMTRRFEGYKRLAVKPFFRDHFAKLDRQIVLVDALSAAARGPAAVADLQAALTEILGCFRPGENSWLRSLLGPTLGGRRIDRLLLAVSKADHIHHTAHPALNALVKDLLRKSVDRAAFSGATVDAMAIAGVRATVETEIRSGGETLPAVEGRLASDGSTARLFPGEPPEGLGDIESGDWRPGDLDIRAFAPPKLARRDGEGPPHLRLDRALEFLIGDKLK